MNLPASMAWGCGLSILLFPICPSEVTQAAVGPSISP